MKFQDFIEKFNGHFIDFDNAWGNQCFDLFHQYCVEVLGLTDGRILAAPAAKDIYDNFDNLFGHENFDKFPNTLTAVPLEGDILIWNNGTWGHVAIFVEGDVNSFRSFDQNFPTGSPCHIQSHNYTSVAGWIRCKKPSIMVQVDSPTFENLVRKSTIEDRVREKLKVEDSETIILAEIDKLIGYEDKVHQQEQQLIEVQAKAKEFSDQAAQKALELTNMQKDVAELQKKLEVAIEDNSKLSTALHNLQAQSTVQPSKPWWQRLLDIFLKN